MSTETKSRDNALKHNTKNRRLMISLIINSDIYKDMIEKGLPFYTLEELSKLEKKYSNGITWNEIDMELSKKGLIFKKSTFRKYIQEKKIPPAKGYKSNEKGRVAVYPIKILEHINFVLFFYRSLDKADKKALLKKLIEELDSRTVTAIEAIEDQLEDQDLFMGVLRYIGVMETSSSLDDAILNVIRDDPQGALLKEKLFLGLTQMEKTFKAEFKKWVKMLEGYTVYY